MARTETLLVLRHNGLGDLVVTRPAIEALKRRFPDHRVVTTCPSWLVPLAAHLHLADRFLSEREAWLDPVRHEAADEEIRATVESVPAGIVAVLRVPDAAWLRAAQASGSGRILAFHHDELDPEGKAPVLNFDAHILDRWATIPALVGATTSDKDFYFDPPGTTTGGRWTLIHPGAASPARRWPVARWATVAAALEASGHEVVVSGSPSEQPHLAELLERAGLPPERDRSPDGSILDLVATVGASRVFLSTDTGPAHLAYAMRVPSVTLFGSVNPSQWGPPLDRRGRHHCIWGGKAAAPYGRQPTEGLLEISPDDVLAGVQRVG